MRYLYASLAAAMVAAAAVPAVAGTLLVPQQFSTIQAALNAAKPYDTVLVSAKPKHGVYSEAVTITTPHVTLQGVGNPVIDGSGFVPVSVPIPGSYYSNTVYPNAIDIRANSVAVRGITIQNVPGSLYDTGGTGINAGYTSADYSTTYGFSGIQISGVTLSGDNNGIVVMGESASLSNGAYTFAPAQNFSLTGSTITGCTGYGAEITGTDNLVITGNTFTSNQQSGLTLGGGFSPNPNGALVAGNLFKNNAADGIDGYGTGLTVTANESASNGDYGILVDTAPLFGTAPASPGPTSVVFNSVHDNGLYGLYITGMQTVAGNSIAKNGGSGIILEGADGSTISGNAISGTVLASGNYGDGAGIFADYPTAAYGADSKLKISLNQISGNAGDGIYFNGYAGGVISLNNVVKNQGIGIHLSDITYSYASYGYTAAPTTVTQNIALHNAIFDARDDASGVASNSAYPGYILDSNGQYYYGDGAATLNVWTKNVFGTTDPVGLSK